MDSNDSLYGSDPKYIAEVESICSTLIEEILAHLKTLSSVEVSTSMSVTNGVLPTMNTHVINTVTIT